ncbi:MAG: alpha-E domain-containing protein [Cytophagales bacterium]|nr:alpha-E domain-containing protein [Cytophagales bacterium]MDW8383771.1 alpha-E domain-containing protein [Flammeovirgaceae bacterium]
MLSRIANHLFWMGRYLERSEHMMRFIEVHYMASLDAPKEQEREIALESILNMVGAYELYFQQYETINENQVLDFCTLDKKNNLSLMNVVSLMRENARAVRDKLSTESWEAINLFYHSLNDIAIRKNPGKEQIPQLYQHVINYTYIIKGIFDNTLLRNEVWQFVSLGLHLERCIQISRSISIKMKDISRIDSSEGEGSIDSYHWSNLLKSACGYDMSRQVYKLVPNKKHAIEFLVLNNKFPNAVLLNLEMISYLLDAVNQKKIEDKNSLEFFVSKLSNTIKYLTIDEINGKEEHFINELILKLYAIGNMIEQKYLMY